MANGHQMERLINAATERVALEGANASSADIMLAGFGYLAHKIEGPKSSGDKKGKVLSASGGLGVGAGIMELIKLVFG